MALYRIYIDEVGNHDMTHADDANQRFLSLTGVIVESSYISGTLQPEMEAIKRKYFQRDPDDPVIFHRKELINKLPPFHSLRNPVVEHEFNTELLLALARWEYRVVTVTLDKRAHRDQYQVWHYHPYHYCLAVLLERFVLFLRGGQHRGDVMIERRGRREDRRLEESYARLYEGGTDYVPDVYWQQCLTSKWLKIRPKSANIAGLQLADLIAHPSRREVLLDHRLIIDSRNTFGDQVCAILRQSKYLRDSRSGRINGYGKKLLP